jgi:nitrogen-specific signal transduction histidine kinase
MTHYRITIYSEIIGQPKNQILYETSHIDTVTNIENGNDIPQKVMDKIFQHFFITKPTGLGLSLSYVIIKAHSGEIKVERKVRSLLFNYLLNNHINDQH